MIPKISVLITYCTNDYPFIKKCIEEVSHFSSDITVVYGSTFFDGSPENTVLIDKTISQNPQAKFIKMPVSTHNLRYFWDRWPLAARIIGQFFLYGSKYWICQARWKGFQHVSKDADYVLFAEPDEIIEGKNFKQWLEKEAVSKIDAFKFATYFYFRQPDMQATTVGDGMVMIRKNLLKKKMFFNRLERDAFFFKIKGIKNRMQKGVNNQVMIHHYSWVRTRQSLEKKVETWSHNTHTNWKKLIKQEFDKGFSGSDFVQHYTYKIVKPYFIP